jgi:hypothetical protein
MADKEQAIESGFNSGVSRSYAPERLLKNAATRLCLERGMASIAENAALAALAATKIDSLGLSCLKLNRREARSLVAAVAKGLPLA